jgi:hypothetical protein
MDILAFDATAKRVSISMANRRTLARLAVGLGLAGGLSAFDSSAQRRRRCKHGKRRCGSHCRNLQRDADNCGRCGTRCAAGDGCFDGICLTAEGTCGPTGPCDLEPSCNGNLICRCRATVSGGTRCAIPPPDGPISCGTCETDAPCIALYGPGAVCTRCCSGLGGCAVPCPD